MNKRNIGILIATTFLLAACTKTQSSTLSFDTFSTTIKSPYLYTQTKLTSDNAKIQKVYTTAESGFQASIIIANEAVLSGDNISFANDNLKTLRAGIADRGEIKDTTNVKLSCGDEEIPASMSAIEVKQSGKMRYITQLYFVYQHKGYIVSHLTEDESEVSGIQKGLSNITCEK
ncbi:MAG: hypothetical protein WCO66_03255 [Candidatus Absconditabacteria bacterium]